MYNLNSSFRFQMSRRIFRQEVPVHFGGNVLLVKNVTKYTACSDVVHMLLLKSGLSIERISSYALFETTRDLERMLPGRTRIMKTLRSWGCEKDNFRFVLRKIEEDEHCRLLRYSDIRNSPERTKLDTKSPVSHQELDMNTVDNSNHNESSVKYTHETASKHNDCENIIKGTNTYDNLRTVGKNGKISKTVCDRMKSKGKQVCFKEYLSTLLRFRKPKRPLQKDNNSVHVCATKTGLIEPTLKDSNDNIMAEIDDLLHDQFHSLEERCRYYWNSNSESDKESYFGDEASFYRDTDLNNAFIKDVADVSWKLNAGFSFNCLDVCSGDLNDAFVNEHNGMTEPSCLSDILEGHYESFSENSDCELDKNITSCDVIRNIFCGHSPGGAIAEDDEMDSFMRTHIYEPDMEEYLV